MQADKGIAEILKHFVCVEWVYDGIGGSVIAWTKAHGNTHEDPAHLGWILDAAGKELAGPADGFYTETSVLAKRLTEMAKASDAAGILFSRGEAGPQGLPEAAEAKAAGELVLLYMHDAKVKACAAFEQKVLGDKRIVKLSRAFRCIRLDLAIGSNRDVAKSLGAPTPPAVVLFPAADGANVLMAKPTAADLAKAMESLATP